MSDLFWLSPEQLAKLEPYFPLVHGVPRMDDRSGASAKRRFDRADFVYDRQKDVYVCPDGEHLIYRFTSQEAGKTLQSYWSSFCDGYVIKNKCTPSVQRLIRRWKHEHVLERMQQRIDDDPSKLALRSMTVEHPFGTIKA